MRIWVLVAVFENGQSLQWLIKLISVKRGLDCGLGIVGKCLGPTTLKGPTITK